jgi:hypothetical protein
MYKQITKTKLYVKRIQDGDQNTATDLLTSVIQGL